MTFHYWTQPSPNPLAFYVSVLPSGFHKASCLLSHALECAVPLLVLVPSRAVRLGGVVSIASFMVLLVATGNYSYLQYLMLTFIRTLG